MENYKENAWILATRDTGSVGIHIIFQLLQKGYKVKATLRSIKRKGNIIEMLLHSIIKLLTPSGLFNKVNLDF